MAKTRVVWRCQSCGSSAPKWLGRCNECGEFGTMVEEIEQPSGSSGRAALVTAAPVSLSHVRAETVSRTSTGIEELDRVLGGGLVAGSLVLLGGEPGIGKSTLLLQVAEQLGLSGRSVLYVCGEESPQQIGLRAHRLGARSDSVSLLPELDVTAVERVVTDMRPDILILDSIQTAYDPDLGGAPGSVGQVRACTARLVRIAKDLGVTTLIVGHVTKDGSIAGPRVLEHMVDAVMYFEGDRDHAFRIVRSVKNRFGSASELGIFEMTEAGLVPVDSPSATLLAERSESVSGSAVMATMEGTRPLLVEIQALVTPTYLPSPRRLVTGLDLSRLLQVVAVLERRVGLSFAGLDVLVSVAGGMRVVEPAVDLPLALALASALRDVPLGREVVAFGEIGLTGHVRPVPQASSRVAECAAFGLSTVLAAPGGNGRARDGVTAIATVAEAVGLLPT